MTASKHYRVARKRYVEKKRSQGGPSSKAAGEKGKKTAAGRKNALQKGQNPL